MGCTMTFTLLAFDRGSGVLGGVTASRSLAVGNAVLALDPAVGIVASQAWTNRELRDRLLTDMASGFSADQAITRLSHWDAEVERRQAGAIDLAGTVSAFTGPMTSPWAGHRVGSDHVALGNLLAGSGVLQAMCSSFSAEQVSAAQFSTKQEATDIRTEGTGAETEIILFAQRLLSALAAGERAGGDRRGRQSASIIVARTCQNRQFPPNLGVDLRVDNHADPLTELNQLLALQVMNH